MFGRLWIALFTTVRMKGMEDYCFWSKHWTPQNEVPGTRTTNEVPGIVRHCLLDEAPLSTPWWVSRDIAYEGGSKGYKLMS